MVRKSVWGIISILVLFSFVACAPVYKLESGNYIMSLTPPAKSEKIPQKVIIIVENEKVTIKHQQKDGQLTGTLKGNAFKIERKADTKNIVFNGQLTSDNIIIGEVIQEGEGDQMVKAPFSIKKQNPL